MNGVEAEEVEVPPAEPPAEVVFPLGPDYPRAPPDERRQQIYYGMPFKDDLFEYRYVILPQSSKAKLCRYGDHRITSISTLRDCGVVIEPGWQNSFFWVAHRQSPTFLLRRSLEAKHDDFLDPPGLLDQPGFQPVPSANGSKNRPLPTNARDRRVYAEGLRSALDALERQTKEVPVNN